MPLRADGSPIRAFRSPGLRLAAPICLPEVCQPQWRLSDGGSPLTVARQLRFRTGFPWCPAPMLSPLPFGGAFNRAHPQRRFARSVRERGVSRDYLADRAVSRRQVPCLVTGMAKSKRSVARARSRSLAGKPGQVPLAARAKRSLSRKG